MREKKHTLSLDDLWKTETIYILPDIVKERLTEIWKELRKILSTDMINGKFLDDRENVGIIRIYKKSDPNNIWHSGRIPESGRYASSLFLYDSRNNKIRK